MSKGNRSPEDDLAQRIEMAKKLLTDALALLDGKNVSPVKLDRAKAASAPRPTSLPFSLNVRAFIKRYGSGRSGPQKFTLLLARLAGGKSGVDIPVKDIESEWKRMTGVMGAYNTAYCTRAKEQGWLNPSKHGVYSLAPSWSEVLGE